MSKNYDENRAERYLQIVKKNIQYSYRNITIKENNMNKLKFIIPMLTLSVTALSGNIQAQAADYCNTVTYIVSDDKAVITGYKGCPDILELPSQINGIPVTEIRENAFYRCESLKKVVIPESVCSIGHYAFYNCTSLETVEINGCSSKIPEGMFYGCKNLKTVDINTSPTVIDDFAFFGCSSISDYNIPLSVTDIGKYSFADCTKLSHILLNNKLKNIGSYAFYNCTDLKKLSLPDSLLSIGRYAIGFSDSSINDDMTITGSQDSVAGHYAKNSGVKFRNRVRWDSTNSMKLFEMMSGILAWAVYAAVYVLFMIAVLKRKKSN